MRIGCNAVRVAGGGSAAGGGVRHFVAPYVEQRCGYEYRYGPTRCNVGVKVGAVL